MPLILRGLRVERGKLRRLRIEVNRAAPLLILLGACAVTFRDVPRQGTNEVREYLGGPTRAASASVVIDSAPVEVWRARAGRGSLGPAAVGDRVTAVATIDRWVYALSTRTGEVYWRYRGDAAYAAGPVMADGKVIVASEGRDGRLTAIDLFTGKRRWQREVGDVTAPLVLRDGTVYGATQRGAVFAHDSESGERKWILFGAPTRSGPLVHDSLVVVVTTDDSLVVIGRRTGRTLRRSRLPASTVAPVALLDDSTVAVTAPSGRLFAVAIPGGAVRWELPTGAPVYGAPAVVADTVFALTNECVLLTVHDGAIIQRDTVAPGCVTVAAPALSRRGVVVATIGGDLLYFDRDIRQRIWTRSIGAELRHPPMLHNSQLIVAPVLGEVVSFR